MRDYYIELAAEKLESLKGQLDYAKKKLLVGHLQSWESKEWSAMVETLAVEIEMAESHLNHVVAIA